MRRAFFTLDELGGQVLEGCDTGRDWNGWAVPLFTLEQAQAVAEAWRARGMRADYAAATETFRFEVGQDLATGQAEEVEIVAAQEVECHKYFPIGAGTWIWEEVSAPTVADVA